MQMDEMNFNMVNFIAASYRCDPSSLWPLVSVTASRRVIKWRSAINLVLILLALNQLLLRRAAFAYHLRQAQEYWLRTACIILC